MARNNPSNPFTQDPAHTQKEVQLPVQKAKVMAAEDHPEENAFHTIRIRVYGDQATHRAPVIAPMFGSVWIPKEGQDVAVIYGDSDKPYVIGVWYPLDRVEDGEALLPDYEAGDIRLGNETGSHVTVRDNGNIHIETGGFEPVNIHHQSASVRMSADQIIPGNDTYSVVEFDTTEDDPEELFDPTEHTLTVRHGGQHRVETTVEIQSAGQNNRYTVALFADDEVIKRKNQQSAVNEQLSTSVATTRTFDDDTELSVRMRQDSGSGKTINSENVATEFSIERHGI